METVRIISFAPTLAPYFLSINKAWIEQYFAMEPFDIDQLEHPQETIVDQGGQILFAEFEGEIVGTVALKKMGDGEYELIKMGVLSKAQGKNIGYLLGQAALGWAREKGAGKVVLYTNSVLGPALHLYRKIGFREVSIEEGKYERCDIKMEIKL